MQTPSWLTPLATPFMRIGAWWERVNAEVIANERNLTKLRPETQAIIAQQRAIKEFDLS